MFCTVGFGISRARESSDTPKALDSLMISSRILEALTNDRIVFDTGTPYTVQHY